MSIAIITSASGTPSVHGSVTTSEFNSTGGETLVVLSASSGDADRTITDDKSNVFPGPVDRFYTAGGSVQLDIVESMITGSGHDVTLAFPYTTPAIAAIVATGLAASPLDQTAAGYTGNGTSIQPGSITPSEDGCLILIAGRCNAGTASISITDGFNTNLVSISWGGNVVGWFSWIIQGSAAAINPTVSASFGNAKTLCMWSLKPAAGGGITIDPLSNNIPGIPVVDPLGH